MGCPPGGTVVISVVIVCGLVAQVNAGRCRRRLLLHALDILLGRLPAHGGLSLPYGSLLLA